MGYRRELKTLFLGGGTPNLLNASELETLFEILHTWFVIDSDTEFTIEANPEYVTKHQANLLRQFGVNRMSLGIQSFDNDKLARLDRSHTGDQASDAVRLACEYFPSVSVDLIFAAPDETLQQWEKDLADVFSHPIQHLSAYGLTIERGARFYGELLRHAIAKPEEETELAMYLRTREVAGDHGLKHYEISSYAKPGSECCHNSVYWSGSDWWGFGPGAAEFIQSNRNLNHQSTTSYLNRIFRLGSACVDSQPLHAAQRLVERVVFGLRQIQGIPLAWIQESIQNGGAELRKCAAALESRIARDIDDGWLENASHRVRLTTQGLVLSDSLWPRYFDCAGE